MNFYVVGAEFLSTEFKLFVPDTLEVFGPYLTYGTALDKWRERSWANVDNCHFKVSIHEDHIPFSMLVDTE
jgi:hypothetical protein